MKRWSGLATIVILHGQIAKYVSCPCRIQCLHLNQVLTLFISKCKL